MIRTVCFRNQSLVSLKQITYKLFPKIVTSPSFPSLQREQCIVEIYGQSKRSGFFTYDGHCYYNRGRENENKQIKNEQN